MERQNYPTDLTDEQWEIIEQLIPPPKPGGRPFGRLRAGSRKTDIREVINAIFHLLR
jgi:transposase